MFPYQLVYGMISALLAAAIWLHIASYLGWPVSTTHSIIGGVLGFGLIAGGVDIVNWSRVGNVVLSWVVSPVMGGLFAYLVFQYINKTIFSKRRPLAHAKELLPFIVAIVFFILSIAIFYKGLKKFTFTFYISRCFIFCFGGGGRKFLYIQNTSSLYS